MRDRLGTPKALAVLAAHVIVDAAHVGHVPQGGTEVVFELLPIQLRGQPAMPQGHARHVAHRCVQHDFLSRGKSLPGKPRPVGGVGQNGQVDLARQGNDRPAVLQAVAEVIDDQHQVAGGSRGGQPLGWR